MAVVLVCDGVHGHGLESAPSDGEHERVARLEEAAEPAVALEAKLQEAAPLLGSCQSPHQQRHCRVPVPDQLARNACAEHGSATSVTCQHANLSQQQGAI